MTPTTHLLAEFTAAWSGHTTDWNRRIREAGGEALDWAVTCTGGNCSALVGSRDGLELLVTADEDPWIPPTPDSSLTYAIGQGDEYADGFTLEGSRHNTIGSAVVEWALIAPNPSCYGCLGTGVLQGFGMQGRNVPCSCVSKTNREG